MDRLYDETREHLTMNQSRTADSLTRLITARRFDGTGSRLDVYITETMYEEQFASNDEANKKMFYVAVNDLLTRISNAQRLNNTSGINFPDVIKCSLSVVPLRHHATNHGYALDVSVQNTHHPMLGDVLRNMSVLHRRFITEQTYHFLPVSYSGTFTNANVTAQGSDITLETIANAYNIMQGNNADSVIESITESVNEAQRATAINIEDAIGADTVIGFAPVRNGDRVSIVSGTYGMGTSVVGDVGIVLNADVATNTYAVQLANGAVQYYTREDLNLVVNETVERKIPSTVPAERDIETRVRTLVRNFTNINNEIKRLTQQKRENELDKLMSLESQHRVTQQKLLELETLSRSSSARLANIMKSVQEQNLLKVLLDKYYLDITLELDAGTNRPVIVAVTQPIEIKFDESVVERKVFPMGQYVIKISISDAGGNTTVSIKGHSDGQTYEGYVHPHVGRDGKPCYGTYNKTISQHLASNDYVSVLYTLYDFLSSCYSEGWYHSIYHWMPANEQSDFCFDCQRERDDCSCDEVSTCERCGDHTEDCTCTRCPDTNTNDLLEDDEFPDVSCLNCSFCVHDRRNSTYMCKYDRIIMDTDSFVHCADDDNVSEHRINHANTRNYRHSVITEEGQYIPREQRR